MSFFEQIFANQFQSIFTFSVLDLQPFLWLKSSDLETISSSSGLVSQWKDKSGYTNDATQFIGSNQPSTNLETINGKNALSWSVNKFMEINPLIYDWGNEDFTIAVVAKASANTNDWRGIVGNRFGALPYNWFTIGEFNNGNVGVEVAAPLQYYDSSINPKGGGAFSIFFIKKGNVGMAYFNNVLFSVQSLGVGACGNTTNRLRIGEWVSLEQCWVGQIAEIVGVPRALSNGERASLYENFKSEWGV